MARHLAMSCSVVSLMSSTASAALRCRGMSGCRKGSFHSGSTSVARCSVSFSAVYTACEQHTMSLLQTGFSLQCSSQLPGAVLFSEHVVSAALRLPETLSHISPPLSGAEKDALRPYDHTT